MDAPSPTFQLKPYQMNFKCKTTTKCLLANAVEVMTKALKDYPRVLITHEKDDTQIADGLVQIVDDLDRSNAFEMKKTTWACPGFILPLMLFPLECIPSLTPKFATVQKDVVEPVLRICQWKTNFKKKKAPTLEDVLKRVGDTTDIRSIFIPTLREQDTGYMQSFVPDDDESDAIINQWTIILENELSSIFWENVWYANLEGRRNFLRLHGSTEEASSPVGQSRSMPCHSPLADESMLPQASQLVDDPRVLLPQQSTWARGESRGGARVASEGVGFENDRDVNVMDSGNEDVGIDNVGGFENVRDGYINVDDTELNVQVRDVRDSVDVGVENYEGVGVENGEGIGVENNRDIGF
ncbi:hypothetical protein TIFTF001_017136 [Ficus carica]|uniref:Uncharacterized protein n=1 Tax=Ficus carica TaxID=3494 RepID=A0AA88D7Z5_FICCA|nr:hypothetical protein TIFTF001_017136 [Ficus carica]